MAGFLLCNFSRFDNNTAIGTAFKKESRVKFSSFVREGAMNHTYTNTKPKIGVVYLLTFATIFFIFGCQNMSLTPFASPPNIPVKHLVGQAVEIVEASLADEDPVIRANAIEVIAAAKQTKLMPKVQRMLKDNSILVRFAAIVAIGDMEYSLAKSDVEQLSNDSNENIRIAVCYALKKLDRSRSIDTIRKAITNEDQTVRANAVWLLGKCGSPDDLKLLYWALQNKGSGEKVRFVAVEAIATLHDERIYPKILSILQSGYNDDRVTGIKAMGALGTQNAIDAIITKLDDPVPEVRLAAAEQLGALGSKTGEPEVLDIFTKNLTKGVSQEDAERIKFRTVLAIGRICSGSLTRFLPQFLNEPSKRIRLAAAQAVLECSVKKK
jgi:HEAT repeat protein